MILNYGLLAGGLRLLMRKWKKEKHDFIKLAKVAMIAEMKATVYLFFFS